MAPNRKKKKNKNNDDLNDLVAAAIRASLGDSDDSGPIGIKQGGGSDFSFNLFGGFGQPKKEITFNLASYFGGDEISFVSDLASSGQLADIQRALIAAKMLPKNTPLGSPDNSTISVIKEAMAIANRTGSNVMDALQSMADGAARAAGEGGGGGGGGAGALLPNPEDVKALLQQTAQGLIGKKLAGPELDAGVNAFYNTWSNPPGGFSAADPSTIAEQYLSSTMPAEVQAHDAVRVYGAFEEMLGGM